jgi:hypothetical protein
MTLDIPAATRSAIQQAGALAAGGDMVGAEAAYKALLHSVADDDYQSAAVGHMYAVIVSDPRTKLEINEEALARAEKSDRFPVALFASLYGNVGFSHVALGNRTEARRWYLKAQDAARGLDDDEYGTMVRQSISDHLDALRDVGA